LPLYLFLYVSNIIDKFRIPPSKHPTPRIFEKIPLKPCTKTIPISDCMGWAKSPLDCIESRGGFATIDDILEDPNRNENRLNITRKSCTILIRMSLLHIDQQCKGSITWIL
jgi:hypothetical protein